MPIAATFPLDPLERGHGLAEGHSGTSRTVSSAVSWGAIAAGAAAGASLSLILLILGVGLGLYWFLFIVLRFILRRDVGSLGISDFLFVVIIGDAAQNGMIGSATSATDGMVLIGTLVFWSYLLDYVSFQFPVIQRFTSAPRLCLVREGKLLRRNMRREFITDEELFAKIRHEGVEDVSTIKRTNDNLKAMLGGTTPASPKAKPKRRS